MKGVYSDMYGVEFECLVLACNIYNGNLLVLDIEHDTVGWCSESLVKWEG